MRNIMMVAALAMALTACGSPSDQSAVPAPAEKVVKRPHIGQDLSNHFDIRAALDPSDGALSAEGSYMVVADNPTSEMTFKFNGGLKFEYFKTARAAEIKLIIGSKANTPNAPNTNMYKVTLAEPLVTGETVRFDFKYAGMMDAKTFDDGRGAVSPRWTEMSYETLWYPMWIGDRMITYDLKLTTPKGYEVTGLGVTEQVSDTEWRIKTTRPVGARMAFVMSNDWLKIRNDAGNGAVVLHALVDEPENAKILDATTTAYAYYTDTYGPPDVGSDVVNLFYAGDIPEVVWGANGYSVNGDYIVLSYSSGDSLKDLLQHEVGHVWWGNGAPGTPDEFLSESLATYAAMRLGESSMPEGWLAKEREKIETRSAKIKSSIRDISGFGGDRQPLIYNRGPAVLWALHDKVGADEMDAFLKAVHTEKVMTLSRFLHILETRQGREIRDWFEAAI